MEHVLNIVFHGSFSGMMFPGSSVVLVPGLQGTLRQGSKGQLKVFNEGCSVAQEPVNTLAHGKPVQGGGCKKAEQLLCLGVEESWAWFGSTV